MTLGGSQELDDLDQLFEVLSNRERRRILYYLREHGTATRRELVDVLAGWAATDREHAATTPDDWSQLATAVHHVHLPKLVDTELVAFDPETGIVRLGTLSPWIDRCLDAAFQSEQALATARGQPTNFLSEELD
ncbi:MAG: ArsR family transcriptional regulator [Halorientalis sp.]